MHARARKRASQNRDLPSGLVANAAALCATLVIGCAIERPRAQLIDSSLAAPAATEDSVALPRLELGSAEYQFAPPDINVGLKRIRVDRYTLERATIRAWFRYTTASTQWKMRTSPPAFEQLLVHNDDRGRFHPETRINDLRQVEATEGSLWRALGLTTGDEFLSDEPFHLLTPEGALNFYSRLLRDDLSMDRLVIVARTKNGSQRRITIDIVGE